MPAANPTSVPFATVLAGFLKTRQKLVAAPASPVLVNPGSANDGPSVFGGGGGGNGRDD
jgi:hypothetical protein